MARQKLTVEQVIAALRAAKGVKSFAAKSLGVDRHTIENYCNRYASVQTAYLEERHSLVDVAEAQLVRKVNAGEWPAIQFALVKLGRDRGYGDTVRHEGPDGGPVTIRVVYDDDGNAAS